MANYILRDLPQDVWDRFKARAMRDQWHLKPLFLQLMKDYASGVIQLSESPKPTPPTGFIAVTCPNGHGVTTRFLKEAVRNTPDFDLQRVHCPRCGEVFLLTHEERDTLAVWAYTRDATDW